MSRVTRVALLSLGHLDWTRNPAVSPRSPPSACSPFRVPTKECWVPRRVVVGSHTMRGGWERRETVTGVLIPPPISTRYFSRSQECRKLSGPVKHGLDAGWVGGGSSVTL